ncbi:MAG: FAD-binding oxidoreductase [Phenylobacterium sp.]|jgi:FAD/FMN-containing dehydrogenase|nr:FAD-binding oxidoreductase [Phenylobacterium sp.]
MSIFQATSELSSWGRVVRARQDVARPHWRDQLGQAVDEAGARPGGGLAVGLARSYGDSGLNSGGAVIAMSGLDRVHGFDPATGVLRADAGMSLDALISLALPHGWFPAVVPGTRFVTLGGAIANDVHGKNHHEAGTFGRHVRRLALHRTDGSVQELSPDDPTGLFAATIGGLGLTGVIAWAELQLSPRAGAFLDSEDIAFRGLDAFFALSEESVRTHAYTAAWVDCTGQGRKLGRGIFSRANPSSDPRGTLHRAPRLSILLDAPSALLNPLALRTFNAGYFALKAARAGRRLAHYDSVFFPLDAIGDWNRLYGRAGFYQYQCVVPPASARDAVAELLGQIAASGEGSVLAVLKTFSDLPSPGLLSFPMEGTTLALDFRNRGEPTLKLFDRFDAIVREAGGRLYPAKDGRIGADMFQAGYPQLAAFAPHVDPGLTSNFWKRVKP